VDSEETDQRLLKNTGVLPLKGVRRIGVFGTDADYPPTLSGCGPDLFCSAGSNERYWDGTVTIGGGSGAAYADYIVGELEFIPSRPAIPALSRRAGLRFTRIL
jgi:beta-glucosidase